jgi:acetyltransferase-like isoleucine patch superfamily enzyme
MKPVLVPTTDVNSETGIVVEWHVAEGASVDHGQVIAEVETSKALLDIVATDGGIIHQAIASRTVFELTKPIAYLFDGVPELEAFVRQQRLTEEKHGPTRSDATASEPARQRAAGLGIDLETIHVSGLITVAHVEAAARAAEIPTGALPEPLEAQPGTQRIAIVGAGLGATQVLDILAAREDRIAVAIVDDDIGLWARDVMGVPVVGGRDRLLDLFERGAFDSVVVSISTSVPARTQLRELCEKNDIPLENAIDPTARIAANVQIGTGNVICAFCHFGVGVRVGDNNFISAYNSFDHHSVLGSDISTGPGCLTSGLVAIGDRVRLGTGIFVEPHVEIGDDAQVASGSILVGSVPAGHAVKRRVVTTTVVPIRRSMSPLED